MTSLKRRVKIYKEVRRMLVKKMKLVILTCYIFIQTLNIQVTNAAEIVSKKINDYFYVLLGGNGQGSHVGLSIGKDYLVLIAAMMAGASSKLIKSILNISDKPIRYVLKTLATHSFLDTGSVPGSVPGSVTGLANNYE